MNLDESTIERFSRQIILPNVGVQGQQRLFDARVLVVGLDPTTATTTAYLAGAGIGVLGLADDECVQAADRLAPLLFAESNLGMERAVAATIVIHQINPECDVQHVRNPTETLAAPPQWDVVLCTAADASRLETCNISCVATRTPLLVVGVNERGAWLLEFDAGDPSSACWACDSSIDSSSLVQFADQTGAIQSNTAPYGGVMGAVAGTEILKLLLGLSPHEGAFSFEYNVATHEMTSHSINKDANCPVCKHPAATDALRNL